MALSLEQKREKVDAAIRAKAKGAGLFDAPCWIVATYDDAVIVSRGDKLYRLPYTLDKSGVTLGAEKPVEITYTNVRESLDVGFLAGPLEGQEGEAADGSKWHVVIIEAGLSKNRRRYGQNAIEAALPLYEGVQVYWNHKQPGASEMRDPRDQAGIITDVRGAVLEGTGSRNYAAVGIFTATDPEARTRLLEAHKAGTLAKQYGLSHDCNFRGEIVREGREAFVDVREILKVDSVDIVGKPAAGGRIMRAVAGLGLQDVTEKELTMFANALEWLKTNRPDLHGKLSATATESEVNDLIQQALKAAPASSDSPKPAAGAAPPAPGQPAAGERGTEAATTPAKQDPFLRSLIVKSAFEGVTLPDPVRKRLSAELNMREGLTVEQATEAVQGWVRDLAPMADQVSGSGLGRIQMGASDGDKVLDGLEAFFTQKPVNGVQPFRSFRQAYVAVTGDTHVTGETRNAPNLKRFGEIFAGREAKAAEAEGRAYEAMTTASLGEILGDSVRRAMLASYRVASFWDQWRLIVSDITAPSDFRTNRRLRFSGYGDLTTVTENQTYPALTSPSDEEATYTISKKGGVDTLTMEMIANDDVGTIRRIPVNLATAAKRTLSKSVFDLLRLNSNIYTGTALALSGQSNISTNALSAAEITTARQKMAEQTAYGVSAEPLDLHPKILIVPTELEELGWRLTSIPMHPESSKATTEPNYIRNRVGLDTLIVMPYWTDATDWWLVTDPSTFPTIEVGFYQGRQEPDIFIADNPLVGSMFAADKIDYKVRFIWGVAVLDYRGFYGGIV